MIVSVYPDFINSHSSLSISYWVVSRALSVALKDISPLLFFLLLLFFLMSLKFKEVCKFYPCLEAATAIIFCLALAGTGMHRRNACKEQHFKARQRQDASQDFYHCPQQKSHKMSHSDITGELILKQKFLIKAVEFCYVFLKASNFLWIGKGTWSALGLDARWERCG